MAIPFRPSDSVELGEAAFLRVIPFVDGGGYDGALFVMDARGEPVEFCFSRIETPRTALWRPRDLARRATVELTQSLLEVCSTSPLLLLARAEEVGPDVLGQELLVEIPVCRVASSLSLAVVSPEEREEKASGEEALHLFWFPEPPRDGEPARLVIDRLAASGLLTEPIERAEAGLREVRSEGPEEP